MTTSLSALSVWRREIAVGVAKQDAQRPATWRIDALFRAACAEASALDATRMGLESHAAAWRALARRFILDASKQKRRA